LGGHAFHWALEALNYSRHDIEMLWLILQTTQFLQSLMELYINHWILIIIRKPRRTCLIIRWLPSTEQTSESSVLYHKINCNS
jgi:hypothetical protein